jgi:two-component system NarL family response regulator
MTGSEAITVVVVDDHPVVRDGLVRIINGEPDMSVVGQAEDGSLAVAVCRESAPAVVVMDLEMPKMGGLEAVEAIREHLPETRFLIFSVYRGDEDIHRALAAGASGYLFKVVQRPELLAAIRKVASGGRYLPGEVADRLRFRHPADALTGRELDVLRGIACGQSNREIGTSLGIGEGTVKTHVNRVLSKLGARDRTQAVVVALERGIIHLGDAE